MELSVGCGYTTKPFNWRFDRQHLRAYLKRLNNRRVERGEEPLELAERSTNLRVRVVDMDAQPYAYF